MVKKGNWQKSASSMDEVKLGSPSTYWSSGLQYRLDLTQKHADFKNKKVLDVGCGVGMFMEKFKKLGAEVFGVDVDKEKIAIAKKKYENVFVSPAEEMPFRSNTFDIIWLHEVIEHVVDDKQTIKECFRVLKKGGKLVIFAPNRRWFFETHGVYRNGKYKFGNIPLVTYLPTKTYLKLIPHVRNYYKKDIYSLFKGHSYKKIAYKRVFPGFDKLADKIPVVGKIIIQFFRFLNKTPLNYFGISHFVVVERL